MKFKNPKVISASKLLDITVTDTQVTNNQIVITGTNLSSVSMFTIKDGASSAALQIESKTSNSLVANTLSKASAVLQSQA